MKTKILSIVIVCMGLFCGSIKADNVDIQTAKEIGAYYFTVATGAKAPVNSDKLELAAQYDNPTLCIPALYTFNVEGNGFVVVSASDATEPIWAYSPEGSLDPKNLNPAAKYMLDSYAEIISEVQNSQAKATNQIKNLWKELEEQTYTCDLSKAGVLVQTKWDQGENTKPSYNVLCPTVNGKYCYAGCVAVAMGQIIKYWNYPVRGAVEGNTTAICSWNNTTVKYKFWVDSNKFVYDSMPNTINSGSSWNNKRAVSKLLFACGVTVGMDWGVDGSGAQSYKVPEALSKWFLYSSEARYLSRSSITDANWLKMLHEELDDNHRPVYYSGFDGTSSGRDAGHAWVIAGTSANDNTKFYINWGWGGSSNGFYTLAPVTAIQTAGGYKFSSNHAMVYKIYPKDLSIDENTIAKTTPAYPNPASDYIMIPMNLPNSATVGVFSMDGKMVDSFVIPAGTHEYRLNLQQYAPGTYVYRLNGDTFKFTVL